MNRFSGQTLAEGWWCENCEMFEQDVDETQDNCIACGCEGCDHVPVEVIGK